MNQPALFTEDLSDALRDVVRALGGMKDVGHRLRPEIAPDDAGSWLKDCLNPKRRERLNPDQVMWLIREGKKAGCHSIIYFLCDDAGYTRPSPLEPKDEAAELQRQFIESTKQQRAIAERLERLFGVRAVA
jgi:hypothetical protein